MTKHALLSASASHRWLNCTASVLACKDLPDEAGEAAQKGTEVHELCAYMVSTRVQRKELDLPQFEYSAIDQENAQTFSDFVQERVEADSLVFVETKVDYSDYTAPNSFGTADCIVINKNIMHVIDYKNGSILVDAYKNTQLELYALGALKTFDLFTSEIDKVELSIIQPNRNNISIYVMSVKDLLKDAETFKQKAQEALNGGTYKYGDWCKFCRNSLKCRAHKEQFDEVLASFNTNTTPNDLTDEEINKILLKESELKSWLEQIKEYALNCAKVGKEWQGFKLAAKSTRKITDENSVANALKGVGIEPYETTTKLKALTNIEKELGKKKTEELIGEYITKVQGKESLVEI